MKIEIALLGSPDINLALLFRDVGKETDKMHIDLVQRGKEGKKRIEIGIVTKSDLKRLAKTC